MPIIEWPPKKASDVDIDAEGNLLPLTTLLTFVKDTRTSHGRWIDQKEWESLWDKNGRWQRCFFCETSNPFHGFSF